MHLFEVQRTLLEKTNNGLLYAYLREWLLQALPACAAARLHQVQQATCSQVAVCKKEP